MRKLAVVIAVVSLLAAAVPLWAHHAFASEFDATKPLKLTGTPAFLIGRVESERVYVSRVIPGATPFAEMAAALDQALAIGDGRKQALKPLPKEGGR